MRVKKNQATAHHSRKVEEGPEDHALEHPGAAVDPDARVEVVLADELAGVGREHIRWLHGSERLKTKNGRKNVKSARYRPILSANGRRQRPAHVYTRANPAQNGQNGGN